MAKSGGGGGRSGGGSSNAAARREFAALPEREQSILAAFRSTLNASDPVSSRMDISRLPSVMRGSRTTQAGMNSIDSLSEKGLITRTSLIGKSGNFTYRLTERGKQILEAN